MKYKKRRRLYSQNYLCNPKLIAKLIRNSSIGKTDTVIEIGPGKGIITRELVKKTKEVIAVELDKKLYLHLKNKISGIKNLELVNDNFLDFPLPKTHYKVFANTPFNITADVIRKLTDDRNFKEGYLVVQKEAAMKYAGTPYDSKNSMMAILLKPWFDISIFWKFKKLDFIPRPSVNAVMIYVRRRTTPFLKLSTIRVYRDFVVYSYNRCRLAKFDTNKILILFNDYLHKASNQKKRLVTSSAKKFLDDQENWQRIRRTRSNKNWKK